MASNKLVLTLALMLFIASAISPLATKALTSNQVRSALAPCVAYLTKGGSPTAKCCNGIKNLNTAANNTPARQQACTYIKALYKSVKGIQAGFAKALPGKCKVNVGYSIDPSINCRNVK